MPWKRRKGLEGASRVVVERVYDFQVPYSSRLASLIHPELGDNLR